MNMVVRRSKRIASRCESEKIKKKDKFNGKQDIPQSSSSSNAASKFMSVVTDDVLQEIYIGVETRSERLLYLK